MFDVLCMFFGDCLGVVLLFEVSCMVLWCILVWVCDGFVWVVDEGDDVCVW